MSKRVIVLIMVIGAMLYTVASLPMKARAANAETYTIEVDVFNQITTVYRAFDGAIVRQMICSTGVNDRTPKGSFRLEKSRPDTDRSEWHYISAYRCFVKYPTRIKGHILFHSLPYAQKQMDTVDQTAAVQLGQPASHGCIRLRWQDAKWISENCPDGTTVRIYRGVVRRDPLRTLLLRGSFTNRSGMSYHQFIRSITDADSINALGPGSSGDAVASLQRCLTGLGFFNGAASGHYDKATFAAVSRFQSAAGLSINGLANEALIRRIMSEQSLTGNYATLYPGCAGPRVLQLKVALKAIGLYGGEMDAHYDAGLADAVEACQRLWHCPVTGSASREFQSHVISCTDSTIAQRDNRATAWVMERALAVLG